MISNQKKAPIHSDWRIETETGLQTSKIYQSLVAKCAPGQDPAGSQVLALVNDATYYAYERTKLVLRHMGEFTLHDGDHLFRVLRLMDKLLGERVIELLSVPELMLLILTAFFHDIGMAPGEAHVKAWRKLWDSNPTLLGIDETEQYEMFRRYCTAYPDRLEKIQRLVNKGDISTSDLLKSYLLSDYIRSTHAERAVKIIEAEWIDRICYRDVDLVSEFAQLCRSHNLDPMALLSLDMTYRCGEDVVVCLPMIGVILRLADLLDFDAKRTPTVLLEHLSVRDPVSIKEWNKHRAIVAWKIESSIIQFHAICTHPAIEASIHSFCDIIDSELSLCNNLLNGINEALASREITTPIKIPFRVDRSKIETKKNLSGEPLYLFRPTQFRLSKSQVIDLLMGTKLYGNPEVALRELVQNSIDACLLRHALQKQWGQPYIPEIKVSYFSEDGEEILEVTDNGTGMDQEIIDKYYTNIGSSFYKSSEFYDLQAQSGADFVPTSRFGIGILSCFMVADTLVVDTRRIYRPVDSSPPLNIVVEGQESIFVIRLGKRELPGTTTRLILRKDANPWSEMEGDEFITSVEAMVPNPPFTIIIETSSSNRSRDESSFRTERAVALNDYSWAPHENIRLLEVDLDYLEQGISGSAVVAILQRRKSPVDSIETKGKSITIDGEQYTLSKNLRHTANHIALDSATITINDEGEITESSSTSYLANSKARVSLHGIEVPHELFPNSWARKPNLASIEWPVPILLMIDVCGRRDLDLNSARTQILMSEKWATLEEELALLIFQGVCNQVSDPYWEKLKTVLQSSRNERFLAGLARVQKEN